MANEHFGLQTHLEHLYAYRPRGMSLTAETPEAFGAWQTELRRELVRLLGLVGRERPMPAVERVSAEDRGDYVQQKWALDVGEGVTMPMYLLVPKADPPYKPVLVFHGHNPSVQYVLGNFPDEQTRAERLAHDGNYAQELARKGYFVCAVEQRGFGERQSKLMEGPNSCRHLAFSYLSHGRTLIGERCWDGMCAIDYLLTRDDLTGPIAATGNSGGGTTTLWLSAIDERVGVVMPSCYFCSFKGSILGVRHCECNYVPGILETCEMGELAASLAPRPFRAIAGEQDDIFPISEVRSQFETVRRAYGLLGVEDRCSLAVHPGPHAYSHELAAEWLQRWM
ncbi:MAG: alpha/beta hydrolase family protein [Phycisphaerae bacterium]